jgi:mannosyltransferase
MGDERGRRVNVRPWRSPPALAALTALALLVLLAGIALRFLATSPLWLDEAQSVAISRLPLPQLFTALREDAAPPLYYLLLHGWMAVVGTGDLAVRALSGLFATAALPLFYQLAKRSGAGLVTLVLAAANPWLVRYATEARPYALEVLLVLLGVLSLEGVYRRPGPARASGLALVAGLLLLTHYWSLFLYAVVGVGVLVALLRTRSRAAGWSLAGLAAGSVLFVPWLPSFWYQTQHTGTPWTGRSGIEILPQVVAEWTTGGVGSSALVLVTWPLTGWGALAGGRRTRLLGAAGAATLLLAFAVAWLTRSAVVGRYTAVVVPLALLLLGAGAALLPRLWSTLIVTGLVISWLAADTTLVTEQRTDAGPVASVLNRQVTDADTVIFCPDQLGPDIVRRLHAQPRLLSFPHQDSPGRLDWVDYAQRIDAQDPTRLAQQVAADRGSGSVWLIPHYGFRPFGERCQQLGVALQAALGPSRQLPVLGGQGGPETLWQWPR